ncbi:hypothetical protein ILUMI_04841, partial [Ignelater luminosus]
SAETDQYMSTLNAFGFKQLITEPTRITARTATLIDHILINNSDQVINSGTKHMHYASVLGPRTYFLHRGSQTTLNIYMMPLRDKALKRFNTSKRPERWNYYKSLRNLVTLSIRNEKRLTLTINSRKMTLNHFGKILGKYNIISSNKPSGIPDYLKDVNSINNYFVSSVDVNSNVTVPREYENLRPDVEEFKFAPVVKNDIIGVLNKIKSNSVGIDITNNMIRYCCPVLIPFLTHLINFCLENGVVPDD